jgi:hypothetical protein
MNLRVSETATGEVLDSPVPSPFDKPFGRCYHCSNLNPAWRRKMSDTKLWPQSNSSENAGLSPRHESGRGFYFAYYYFFGIFHRLHAGGDPV